MRTGPHLGTRTEVSQEFVDEMIKSYTIWLEGLKKIATQRGGYGASRTTAARLIPIVRLQSDPEKLRSGYDYEVTRLHCLPYKSLTIYEHTVSSGNDKGLKIKYFCAHTKHVEIHNYKGKSVMGQLGEFKVFVPLNIFQTSDLTKIHMIPVRNPNSFNRHPHHYANNYSVHTYRSDGTIDFNHSIDPKTIHPLDRTTGNCWGSYQGPIQGMLSEPDFPEFFQQIFGHLRTYGDRPPKHMESLDYDWHTPEEK